MRFPNALWKPVASYSAGRRSGYPVRALLWHSAVGPAQAVYDRFKNPANGASTHGLVLKDGSGWGFVDTRDTAWANGALNRWGGPDPLVPWLAGVYHVVAGTGGPNWSTGSAELEGGLNPYAEPLTGPQYITMVEWTAAFLTFWDLGPPIRHINLLEHNQISATACPSGRVPWQRLIPDTLDLMEVNDPMLRELIEQLHGKVDALDGSVAEMRAALEAGTKGQKQLLSAQGDALADVLEQQDRMEQKIDGIKGLVGAQGTALAEHADACADKP